MKPQTLASWLSVFFAVGMIVLVPGLGAIFKDRAPNRIAQLLAETGPLNDFKSIDQLLRYAGLNIREHKSGYFTGKNKISKKGRSNLRRVLGYIVLPLVKKKSLYGTVYHAKKDSGMVGNKAMVAMMRKFLRMFYGWYKSGIPFDKNRVFNDEVKCLLINQ